MQLKLKEVIELLDHQDDYHIEKAQDILKQLVEKMGNKIVFIVSVEMLSETGLQQLQAKKVFTDAIAAEKYQKSINDNPIYQNIKAFAFCEPAISAE